MMSLASSTKEDLVNLAVATRDLRHLTTDDLKTIAVETGSDVASTLATSTSEMMSSTRVTFLGRVPRALCANQARADLLVQLGDYGVHDCLGSEGNRIMVKEGDARFCGDCKEVVQEYLMGGPPPVGGWMVPLEDILPEWVEDGILTIRTRKPTLIRGIANKLDKEHLKNMAICTRHNLKNMAVSTKNAVWTKQSLENNNNEVPCKNNISSTSPTTLGETENKPCPTVEGPICPQCFQHQTSK